MIGLNSPSLSLGASRGGAASGTAAPFTSIAADGWQATVASPTDLSLTPATVTRAGYDSTGTATTYSDTLYLTKRVRQVYPNNASFTTDQVALNEYIYAADTISGATNNSTEVSPKPIARWCMVDRLVVGSTFHWEIVAFHHNARLGKQVACVRVRATDGTNSTAWQTVTTPTVSTTYEDARPTAVYQNDLDISALPDGLYWLEGEVYPNFGVAASVLTSDNSTISLRAFGKRWFTKDATLASTPPYVYVASTGNDTTGVCSTTAATAAATPCLTLQGAINKAIATLAGGKIDGLIVRIVDTVAFGTTAAAARNQVSGAVIVERAPGTARSAAIVQQSSAQNFRFGTGGTLNASLTYGALIFKDVTVQRTATGQLGNSGTTYPLHVQLWNAAVNHGSVTGAWGSANSAAFSRFGTVETNLASNTLAYSSSSIHYMLRGVVATVPSSGSYEGGSVIGSTLTGVGSPAYADAQTGAVWYNTAFPSPSTATAPIEIAAASSGQTITGVAIVQCFVEPVHTTSSTPSVRLSSDSANGNITHMVMHHNVVLGAGALARFNLVYDDTTGVTRTHKFVSFKGNIAPQINVKGDIFKTDGTRIGNFPFVHGVGCRGNFSKYSAQSPTTEAQSYPGIASNIGTSSTVLNDPVFVDDNGTTLTAPSTYNAGTGGSDVHLDTGSPCIGIVDELLLSHDYAGTARSGTQDAGLYA